MASCGQAIGGTNPCTTANVVITDGVITQVFLSVSMGGNQTHTAPDPLVDYTQAGTSEASLDVPGLGNVAFTEDTSIDYVAGRTPDSVLYTDAITATWALGSESGTLSFSDPSFATVLTTMLVSWSSEFGQIQARLERAGVLDSVIVTGYPTSEDLFGPIAPAAVFAGTASASSSGYEADRGLYLGEFFVSIDEVTTPGVVRNLHVEICGAGPCEPFTVPDELTTLATSRGTGWTP